MHAISHTIEIKKNGLCLKYIRGVTPGLLYLENTVYRVYIGHVSMFGSFLTLSFSMYALVLIKNKIAM